MSSIPPSTFRSLWAIHPPMTEMQAPYLLLVEDDRDIRESLTELLKDEGYQVASAENGQHALDFLRAASTMPELILLDLMMPVKDGFQFLEEHKQDSKLSSIPIVVMSADGRLGQSTESRSALLAQVQFLRKPLDVVQLLDCVAERVSKRAS